MRSLSVLLLALLAVCSVNSHGHQLSTAYLTGSLTDAGVVQGEWQLRLYDLEQAVGVDADRDGTLLWGELQGEKTPVMEYLSEHLRIARAGAPCPLLIEKDWQVSEHFNEGYLVVPLRAQCAIAGPLEIKYGAFFAQDDEHKLLVALTSAGMSDKGKLSASRIISSSKRSIIIDSANGNRWLTAQEFTVQGAIHIWKGLDHILFLLSLLLTCVLVRQHNRWVGKTSLRDIVVSTTWVVTAFTLAHSLTLTATALGWINFSSRWVEVGIAVSVAIAALNNIFPLVLRLGWLTFGFGLLHGMGFAGVLGELGLPADQKLLAILTFNLGVEFGQLVIVAVVLPPLVLARNSIWYSRYALVIASLAITSVAFLWVFERL